MIGYSRLATRFAERPLSYRLPQLAKARRRTPPTWLRWPHSGLCDEQQRTRHCAAAYRSSREGRPHVDQHRTVPDGDETDSSATIRRSIGGGSKNRSAGSRCPTVAGAGWSPATPTCARSSPTRGSAGAPPPPTTRPPDTGSRAAAARWRAWTAPDHSRLRRLLSRVVTVRHMEALRPHTQELVSGFLDQLDVTGPTAELVHGLCGRCRSR